MEYVRCSCFKRVRLREDDTPEHALENHRFSGECPLVERPKPIKTKRASTRLDTMEFSV